MGTFAKAQGPIDLFTVTFGAEGSISEFNLVILGTLQNNVKACDSSNAKTVVGVSQKTVTTGNPVPVRVHGVTKVIADDGSIAAGDYLKSGTTTKTRVTSIGAGDAQQHIVGKALQASNAAGDEITMLLLTVPGATVS